jgi:broad specificity phosphatase PhoE
MLKSLDRIAEAHPVQIVAAVSHELPIRLLVARIAGLRGPELWDLLVPTGCVVRVQIDEGRFSLPPPRPVLVSRRWREVEMLEDGG